MNNISYSGSIVIVGEGPAGLASSIVAKLQNFKTLLIRKRETYSREQVVFLKMSAIRFLKRIHVLRFLKIEMVRLNSTLQALVPISQLEKALFFVAQKLGVKVIQGEFEKIDSHSILLKDRRSISYEMLVGADGAHSKVREALNIKCHLVGKKTLAASVFISKNMENSQVQEVSTHQFSLRNVHVPAGIFLLLHVKSLKSLPYANKQALLNTAISCGFGKEAEMVKKNRDCVLFENVEVSLQQATHFCDSSQDAILVGDSTTAGSFYLGRGVNLAFEIVEVAEKFFTMERDAFAYHWYNQQVKKLSDELITNNLPLFSRL